MVINIATAEEVAHLPRRGQAIPTTSNRANVFAHICSACNIVGHSESRCPVLHAERKEAERKAGKPKAPRKNRAPLLSPRDPIPPPEPKWELATEKLIIDTEVCFTSDPSRHPLGRMCVRNYNDEIVWDVFVYEAGVHLTGTNIYKTGIKFQDLRPENGAWESKAFMSTFKKLVQGRILIVHDGINECKALKVNMPIAELALKGWRDTAKFFRNTTLWNLGTRQLKMDLSKETARVHANTSITLKVYRLQQEVIDLAQKDKDVPAAKTAF